LVDVTLEALALCLEKFPPKEIEILDRTDPRRPRMRKAKLIFLNSRGRPMRRAPWSYVWTKAVAPVGLPEGYGFHGLGTTSRRC